VDHVDDAENLDVTLKSLELITTFDPVDNASRDEKLTLLSEATETTGIQPIKSYSAMMTFIVKSLGGGVQDLPFNILYDVYFVTAHPCVPSHHTSLLGSPTSPLSQPPKIPPHAGNTIIGAHELFTGMYIISAHIY
jgi:hypothetical protein